MMDEPSASGEEPFNRYVSELGLFVHEFSRAERILQQLLRIYAGVTDEVAWAVFSGVRADGAKDFINRILEAQDDLATKGCLTEAFGQLGVINGIRNNIVHWGATKDGQDDFLVTNAHLTPGPRGKREYRISPDDLRSMSLDLVRISSVFTVAVQRPNSPVVWALAFSALNQALGSAWHYKPPPQSPPERSNPAHHPKQKPPPQS